jgi:hypothetical protein
VKFGSGFCHDRSTLGTEVAGDCVGAARASRVGTLLSPGLWIFNIAAYKDFWVNERITLQFRRELFNAFNHPNFSSPNTSFGAGSFG